MITSGLATSSPTADLCQFLDELPLPFREQLLIRLYMFFLDDVEAYASEPPDDVLELVIAPSTAGFKRAILIIGALDYIFSQKVPWSSQLPEQVVKAAALHPNLAAHLTKQLMKVSEMHKGKTVNPVREKPYQAARSKWKKLRSNWSNSTLHEFEQGLAASPDAT
jgi:hypothetical protein